MELEARGTVTRVTERTYQAGGQQRTEEVLTILNAGGTDVLQVKWTDFSTGKAPAEGDKVHIAVRVRMVVPRAKPDGYQGDPFLSVEAVQHLEVVPAPPRAVKAV